MRNPEMLEFTIPTMSCGHCVRAITEAVHQIDPQAEVETDLATRQVRVQTQAPREAVVACLTEAEYAPV
jgi:copper chaperone